MKLNLPRIFFKMKDNGAQVYRVAASGKSGRIEFFKLATVVVKARKINTQKDSDITEDEMRQIEQWLDQQSTVRLTEDLRRISRDINLATHQISATAEVGEELEAAINDALLSVVDLQREIAEKLASGKTDQLAN